MGNGRESVHLAILLILSEWVWVQRTLPRQNGRCINRQYLEKGCRVDVNKKDPNYGGRSFLHPPGLQVFSTTTGLLPAGNRDGAAGRRLWARTQDDAGWPHEHDFNV